MFRDADARVLVVEKQFSRQAAEALSNIGAMPMVLMVGESLEPDGKSIDFALALQAATAVEPQAVSRFDNACIMYTSGTTGPSKGVLHSQASLVEFGGKAQWLFEYTSEDVSHNCLPLFHANALCVTLLASVRAGATSVFGRRFSASGFWPEVRQYQATVTSILGAMVPILGAAWSHRLRTLREFDTGRIVSTHTACRNISRIREALRTPFLVSQYRIIPILPWYRHSMEHCGAPGICGRRQPRL